MGQPIWVPGQPVRGLIQRSLGWFCVGRVYFIRKSTEFHDMWKMCQRIKTSHSFITVLFLSRKYPEITWSVTLQSLKNHPFIASQFLPDLLKLFCQTSSLPLRMKNWTLFQKLTFLLLLPLQWLNIQKYFSLKIHQNYLASQPTKRSASSVEYIETFSSTYHPTKTKCPKLTL